MDHPAAVKELCVALLSGAELARTCEQTALALRERGFEVFAEVDLPQPGASTGPEGFPEARRAIIAFNPLLQGKNRRDMAIFTDLEVEKAAHLLAVSIDAPETHLRMTTNSAQATALARNLLTAPQLDDLKTRIRDRQKELETEEPVLADLSRFKYRAKVELIEWQGERAIKKTFRPAARDAMAREQAFFEDMSEVSTVPARLRAVTHNALVFEFIDNCLQERRLLGLRLPIPLPLKTVRQLAEFVHLSAGRGWDPLDLTPANNIMIDRKTGNLRAIDFEFAHRWEAPLPPEKAYFLSGVPEEATMARPLNNAMEQDPYPSKWRPYTGLSKTSFLNDPAWLQTLKRFTIHPLWLAAFVFGALRKRRKAAATRSGALEAIALAEPPLAGDPVSEPSGK